MFILTVFNLICIERTIQTIPEFQGTDNSSQEADFSFSLSSSPSQTASREQTCTPSPVNHVDRMEELYRRVLTLLKKAHPEFVDDFLSLDIRRLLKEENGLYMFKYEGRRVPLQRMCTPPAKKQRTGKGKEVNRSRGSMDLSGLYNVLKARSEGISLNKYEKSPLPSVPKTQDISQFFILE